jgi:phosphoribosylanthranilate isomerase
VTIVKVCGIRSVEDGRAALEAGANLLGFILWRPGKRYIAPPDAANIIATLRRERDDWSAVGVFVDPTRDEVDTACDVCNFDYVQLSGNEARDTVQTMPRRTIKAVHVRPGQEAHAAAVVQDNALGADLYLLDTHTDALPGGTGVPFDWPALRAVGPHCLVAGGLRPDNVGGALRALEPLGVDVSSGVEFSNARGKDPRLIKAFMEAVRDHDARPR